MKKKGDLVLQKERDKESVKLKRKLKIIEQVKKEKFTTPMTKERSSCPLKRETENQYEINKGKESILPNNG